MHKSLSVLVILLGLVLVFSVVAVASADPPAPGAPSSGTETWIGNGGEI